MVVVSSGKVGRVLAGYRPVLLSNPGPVFGSDACADGETNNGSSERPPTTGPNSSAHLSKNYLHPTDSTTSGNGFGRNANLLGQHRRSGDPLSAKISGLVATAVTPAP